MAERTAETDLEEIQLLVTSRHDNLLVLISEIVTFARLILEYV